MKRMAVFTYGLFVYAVFLGSVLCGFGFVGNLIIPKTVDSGAASLIGLAVAVDLGLIALFGIQHSVMARPAFKRWWQRFVPPPVERSTYVFFSALCLYLTFWLWRPINVTIWSSTGMARTLLTALFWIGWALVVASTFLIDHFDLFGLRQVTLYLRGIDYTPVPFRQPAVYRYVRHPLMLSFLVAFWATARMTVGHLIFALGMTVYILVGVTLEERDLVATHGAAYEEYRKRVSMLLPLP